MQSLSEIKLVAATLPTLPGWDLPSDQGQQQAPRLEYHTLLGPLLRLSTFPDGAVRPSSCLPFGCDPYAFGGELVRSRAPLPLTPKKPSLPQAYFPEPSSMVRGNIDSASASLRGTLHGVQVRVQFPLSLLPEEDVLTLASSFFSL